MKRFDITRGQATFLYDFPYLGEYETCGNLWISEDGFRIFTGCGHVFRSSESEPEDMLYNGTLGAVNWITA